MPPQMRAFATSCSNSLTVAKWRSPRPVRLGTVKSIRRVPRNRAMARPVAGMTHEWALGYSGWFGVAGEQRSPRRVALGRPCCRPCRRRGSR